MTAAVDLTIIDKVKKLLNSSEENSPLELLQILRRHRNNFHPDKYTDEAAIAEAKVKFVEISELIKELESHIERERLHKTPMELALYEPLYDNSTLQTKLDNADTKIAEIAKKNEILEIQIKQLKEALEEKQESAISEKQNALIALYKPSNNRVLSISFVVVLSGIIPVLTKIKAISEFLTAYFPLPISQINIIMFILFSLVIINVLVKYIEYRIIKNRIGFAKSSESIQDFFNGIPNKKEFSENQVYAFISGKKSRLKRFLAWIGIRNYKAETVSYLKDVFIHNLIQKQFIDVGYAEGLDRFFKVKGKPRYYSDMEF